MAKTSAVTKDVEVKSEIFLDKRFHVVNGHNQDGNGKTRQDLEREIVELGRKTAAHNAKLIATDLLQDQSPVG